jgi:glutamyl-tRNA synthetase
LLRFEDIDRPRVVAESQSRILSDLSWLGLDWDGSPILQSERTAHYERAIAILVDQGLVYPCDCSRAEVARVASAPHPGEEIVYPGTCRDRNPMRCMKRPPALRAHVPDEEISFEDGAVGPFSQNLARDVGDFVLRRGDGTFSYQLAVVVDDLATGVTDVVRGMDLLGSTPRQIWLARSLGLRPPRFTHVPLVVATDGARIEKRSKGWAVHELRLAGISASSVVGELAFGLGLMSTNAPVMPAEVAHTCSHGALAWRGQPWAVPASLVPSGPAFCEARSPYGAEAFSGEKEGPLGRGEF